MRLRHALGTGLGLALLGLAGGCALPGQPLGVDDATLITVKAEIPLTAELPPLAVSATDREISYAFAVVVPVDVIAELEARGRKKDAKTLRDHEDKLRAVELDDVQYEIVSPNQLPVDVDPVMVYIGPETATHPDETTRAIGTTDVIPAHTAVARRSLILTSTGLADASAGLTSLHFALIFDTALRVPRAQGVPAKALRAKIRLKLRARIDLAG